MTGDLNTYNQTIIFDQTYNQVPFIFLGFNHLDIGYNTQNISYEVIASSVTLTQATLTVQKFDSNSIYGLHIFYLVIQDIDVIVQNFQLFLTNGNSYIQNFKLPPKDGTQNKVQCLITGINVKYSSNSTKQFGISVTNTQNNYTIQIQGNQDLSYIRVNCLEYYQYATDPYSKIEDVQFHTSENISDSQSLFLSTLNNYTDSQLTSFIGITLIDTQLPTDKVLRAGIFLDQYNEANHQQPVLIQTWNSNTLNTIQALFFDYQMYNCKQNEQTNQINHSDQKNCVQQCPQRYFKVSFRTTDICQSCQPSCLTCNNKDSCLTCDQGKYLNNSQCQDCDSSCLTCENKSTNCKSCSQGKYLYQSCQTCDSSCQTCDSPCLTCKNTSSNCTSCSQNSILYNNQCYVQNQCKSNSLCQYCFNSYCIVCQQNNVNSCSTSCLSNQFNYQSQCSSTQPENTYCDQFKQCTQCQNSCLACSSDLKQCISCNNQFLFDGSCYPNQPNSTQCDNNKICTACKNKACQSCDGSLNNCLTCPSQKYLFQNQCYSTQPSQTGCNNYICNSCQGQNCMFCNSLDLQCSTCINNYYLYNSKCSSTQPTGTHCSFDQNNHYYNCEICTISGCQYCNSNKNECSTCSSNQFMYNNNCYSSQPAGTNCRLSNNNFFTCSQCKQSGCLTCQNNINQCSSCLANQFLFNFQCYNQQPSGTICSQSGGNLQNYNCQSCTVQGCQDCNAQIDKCSSCQSGQYFYNSQCFNKQPNQTYCSSDNNFYSCKNCLNQLCQSCDNSLLKCISCVYYLFEGNCYKSQPQNTYCDHTTRICNQCLNQSCKTCQSNLSTCSSCPNQYYMLLGQCTKEQPDNSYCDQEKNCFKCKDQTCQTCDQNLQKCKTCPRQTYLYENQCHQQQPQNSFCQNKSEYLTCKNILQSGCNISCGVCYGKNQDQCVSCSSETRIYQKDVTTCECKDGYSEVYEMDCEENLFAITIFLNLSSPLTYVDQSTLFLH
ncbi:H-type lectin domain protein (macronuclear) [Tetrahymena thermophila SB210]|uniref:H-type lectin domain protein n=1 Tax=Tetrahymena thermophila (strain SB210) TaxID=312017 RepID=Q22P07_TETTS|nr:H-type lectin domain protein [Tetrahymena thermophila SB210]EAR87004.2 H-type lectin domain protein [Tetrahymena thermophila SB210]|eukprot:XP_001007249.2 H-type lectin domain protein [Tetrahymena thermophila SB210]